MLTSDGIKEKKEKVERRDQNKCICSTVDKNRYFCYECLSDEKKKLLKSVVRKVKSYNESAKDEDKIFIAFRAAGKIDFYSNMRAVFTIKINSGNYKSILILRNRRRTLEEKDSKRYPNYQEINVATKNFKEAIERNTHFKTKRKDKNDFEELSYEKRKLEDITDTEFDIILEKAVRYIKYLQLDKSELAIQNLYATKYNGKNELYIVDSEFVQYFEDDTVRKNNKDIKGRYDMIGINRGKLVFIELKVNKNACVDSSASIDKHIINMRDYLKRYNENELNIKSNISSMTKNTIDLRKKLGILEENVRLIENSFDSPEFWILYDSPDETKEEIEEYLKSKVKNYGDDVRFLHGNVRSLTQIDTEYKLQEMRIK